MSMPTASCLPSTKAREAVKYVIGMVLDFNLVHDCPLWLAMLNDVTDESQVNLYNQWLWLTPDDILALQYHPEPLDYNGYMEGLLSAAQNHDAKILLTTKSQNRCANAHSSFPSESYDEEQYNIDISIDTIWVNAQNTVLAHYGNSTHVSDDAWSKLPQNSWNIWMSLPIDDRKLILGASDSVSSITKTSSSMPSMSDLC